MRPLLTALILASPLIATAPTVLSAQATDPHEGDRTFAAGQPFETAFRNYLSLQATKAFAVAVDRNGAWAGGWSHGHDTPEEAERAALASCRDMRPRYSVAADCQVIAVDGTVMRQRVPFRFSEPPKQESLPKPTCWPWCPEAAGAANPNLAGGRFQTPVNYEVHWVNGTNFVVGSASDLQLWVAFVTGRDPQALVYLVNATERSITFAPESITAIAGQATRKGFTTTAVKVFSAPEYERRVRNKQAWQAALHGAAVAIANQPQPQSSTFSGNYSAYRPYQPRSQIHGSFYGQITRWPTAADYAASWERSAAQMQAMGDQLRTSFDAMAASLMRTHTLSSGTFYGGVVHLARFRAERVGLTIPFGGAVFQVEFTMP